MFHNILSYRNKYLILCFLFFLNNALAHAVSEVSYTQQSLNITGTWIMEPDHSTMLDPQTSGLSYYNGKLYSVSDGSAHESQIKKLHVIDPLNGKIEAKLGPLVLADHLQSSCFASYLNTRPDYEGLKAIPNETNAWLLVTEDATRSGEYSQACQQKYAATGSTLHPTLLVKIVWQNNQLTVMGVRALQFAESDGVGNFPNDGIEGIAITRDGRIFLGLEKDKQTQARIFELAYSADMFEQTDSFLVVIDSGLHLPKMEKGNHPINAMDVYYPKQNSGGFLIAAARNDDQLWVIDLANKQTSSIIDMTLSTKCDNGSEYKIAIAAIEGLAVHGDILYLINDPWKKVYADNANMTVCPSDKIKYERMSPLLFSSPLNKLFSK